MPRTRPRATELSVTHERIDDSPPCGRLATCLTADITRSGVPDVVVCGLGATAAFEAGGVTVDRGDVDAVDRLVGRLERNVFWYENPGWTRKEPGSDRHGSGSDRHEPGWTRHDLATGDGLRVGAGATGDLTGDGRVDVVVGQADGDRAIYWYEQRADPRTPWRRTVVSETAGPLRDLVVTDVDDDGEPELVGLSADDARVFAVDVPPDPCAAPWGDEHLTVVDDGVSGASVAVADVDGDGRSEVLAGTNVYHRSTDGDWTRDAVLDGWADVHVAVADLDLDGDRELLYVESGREDGAAPEARLGWVDPPDWEAHVLREDLSCPHSLKVGDVTGNGWPDVYVAELGGGDDADPGQYLFANAGGGNFRELTLDGDVPLHDATLADLDGDHTLDVVGTSATSPTHVDWWDVDP
jgi:hypothetical protein